MGLNDLDVYGRSMRLAEELWADGEDGPSAPKYSVAANISEGHGRCHFGENRQFCYYARGSLQEARTWLQKARSQRLISKDRFNELSTELVEIRKMLNGYINSIGQQNTSS